MKTLIVLCCLMAMAMAYKNSNNRDYYDNADYYDNYDAPASYRRSSKTRYSNDKYDKYDRRSYKKKGSMDGYGRQGDYQYDDYYNYEDNAVDNINSNSDFGYGAQQTYGGQRSYKQYAPVAAPSQMDPYARSSYKPKKPATKYVPVVVKKKKSKKSSIISTHSGFYIPGGTQMFGKFHDMHSCEKACELTPTCFGGDFNPWTKKCFMHSNLTGCQAMSAHKSITHFTKVPCNVPETPRGLVSLGIQTFKGIVQSGVKSLSDCIKKCATSGGGIAATDGAIKTTPQLCFGVDFNFANHKCYFIVPRDTTHVCPATGAITTSKLSVANPTVVNILLCPKAE